MLFVLHRHLTCCNRTCCPFRLVISYVALPVPCSTFWSSLWMLQPACLALRSSMIVAGQFSLDTSYICFSFAHVLKWAVVKFTTALSTKLMLQTCHLTPWVPHAGMDKLIMIACKLKILIRIITFVSVATNSENCCLVPTKIEDAKAGKSNLPSFIHFISSSYPPTTTLSPVWSCIFFAHHQLQSENFHSRKR